jgi:protein SCO1
MLLGACGTQQPPFALEDISGLMPPLELHLTDQDGRQVTADNYRAQVVLLYFGYTQCPDVCPTTLATLARALHTLGPDAASHVRVLFVSVDPQRDTAAVLRSYVRAFGPEFVGLRGDDSELTALTKRYRVAYSRDLPDAGGSYAVAHSSAVFIFQKGGAPRLLARARDSSDAIAGDLRRLLASS